MVAKPVVSEATLTTAGKGEVLALFGPRDQHVRKLRRLFSVDITNRDGRIRIAGHPESVAAATRTLEKLRVLARGPDGLHVGDVERAAAEEGAIVGGDLSVRLEEDLNAASSDTTLSDPTRTLRSAQADPIDIRNAGRKVRPRTPGQARYVEAIRDHDLTFAIGPAGCGKTYLAVAMAVEALRNQAVRKIVLVRPAVEAGENLGFLPGDLRAKLNPYLRPLLDALGEMVNYDQARSLMEEDVIEIIPLAYMRGRTLNDAFIILDEAQNTTVPQMKMFLTRMGERSKMVVSGDATQLDLPRGVRSGLHDALQRLRPIRQIACVQMQPEDIVRHPLVQRIVGAYDDGGAFESRRGPGRQSEQVDDEPPDASRGDA